MQSDTKTGMADRPSERRRLGAPTPDLAGTRAEDFPRRTLEDKVVRSAAKSFLRYPARHGGEALQASGGRRRRPSRAFFAPNAGSGHGHRARAWTPCSSSADCPYAPRSRSFA